jgi:hypothetical protein
MSARLSPALRPHVQAALLKGATVASLATAYGCSEQDMFDFTRNMPTLPNDDHDAVRHGRAA